MKIPLYLNPDDQSRHASQKRLDLYEYMVSLNPSGFRKIPGSSPKRVNPRRGRDMNAGIQRKINTLAFLSRYGA